MEATQSRLKGIKLREVEVARRKELSRPISGNQREEKTKSLAKPSTTKPRKTLNTNKATPSKANRTNPIRPKESKSGLWHGKISGAF